MNLKWTTILLIVSIGISSDIFVQAHASSTGKIYLSGTWIDANVAEESLIPNTGVFDLALAPADLAKLAKSFLSSNALALHNSALSSFEASQTLKSETLETHRFQKKWQGLEVIGGDAVVHLRQGKVLFGSADGTGLDSLVLSARVSPEQALSVAFSAYRGPALKAEKPQLKVLLQGKGQDRKPHLTYAVKVIGTDSLSSDVHFIDANTAQEVLSISNVHTVTNRKVLAALGTQEDYSIVSDTNADQLMDQRFSTLLSDSGCTKGSGGFSYWETWKKKPSSDPANPSSCGSAQAPVMNSANAAFANSGLVLSYYQNSHNRDSVDGKGMPVRSVVNFAGTAFKNAAWYNDRKIMLYGMGDGDQILDFASPLDVVAHEITHGVTANTAALEYASESGALNESYSDVFGKLVAFANGKSSDWKIGRELFRNGSSFIRDMENPQVAHTKSFKYRGQTCDRYNDFCGVHDNSGIPNRAAVLIAKRLGNEKLGKIYYLTLTQLLRSSSDFQEARAQTEMACATLLGKGTADCQAVRDAFDTVGVF